MSSDAHNQSKSPPVLADYIKGNSGLAQALDKSKRTIDRWKALGEVPPFTRIGREILYHRDDVRDWLKSRRRVPRSAGR